MAQKTWPKVRDGEGPRTQAESTTDILLHVQIFKLPFAGSVHTITWGCFQPWCKKHCFQWAMVISETHKSLNTENN